MASNIINGGAKPNPITVGPAPIVHITDGADGAPVKALTFGIEPKQDLHGYSNPWPAGGGVNLLAPRTDGTATSAGVTLSSSDGVYTLTDTSTGTWLFDHAIDLPAGSYACALFNDAPPSGSGTISIYLMDASNNILLNLPVTAANTTKIFTLTAAVTKFRLRGSTGNTYNSVKLSPIIVSGSTVPTTFSPYSNICPISGWAAVDGWQSGVNVWDEEWELGSYDNSGAPVPNNTIIRTKNFIGVKPSKEYWIQSPINGVLYWYDASKTFISLESFNSNGQLKTAPANAVYLRFRLASTYGTTYNNDISINYPSTDHAYHAYRGTPITFTLGQTVYGGYVDAIAGKCVVTMIAKDMGDLTWTNDTNRTGNFYTTAISDVPDNSNFAVVCSSYAVDNTKNANTIQDGQLSAMSNYGGRRIFVKDVAKDSMTGAQFKTAVTGQTLIVTLATPVEISLTPVTNLSTLLGENNFWADSGDTTLTYYQAASSVVAVYNRSNHVYVSIPLSAIRYDTYSVTPQQAIDLDSYRSETGTLIRNVVGSKCKLEFNTPSMNNTQWAAVWDVVSAGFNNANEKKVKLKYFDTLSATYKTGYFYVPDVQTQIRNIDEPNGIINYDEIRIAFIEY